MTGYGRGTGSVGPLEVGVEISGVNRKQLDIAATLPREFSCLENVVREVVSRRVARGRVNVTISIFAAGTAAASAIDGALAKAYFQAMKRLQRELGAAGEVTIETVLRAPGVLKPVESTLDMAKVESVLRMALDEALESFVAMRLREGRHLKLDVSRRATAVARAIGSVRKLVPASVRRYRETLLTRLKSAGLTLAEGDERLLKEITLFAERSDVSEELSRIDSHLAQFKIALTSSDAVGRQLEFIVQELVREFNTLGSKSQDVGISRLVLECKSELEKIREQVQNIE